MGQLLGNLTQPNSALADPNTGAPQMVPPGLLATNPDQAMLERNRDQLNAGTPPQMSIGANGQATFAGPKPYDTPQAMTPSFSDAAQAGAMPGSTNVMSPELNKAGKLVTLLTSGLQGALAGRAANEQATVQSGGRRSGGIGMAMESGYNLPFQRAQVQQELQKGQAQTELLQAQSQMVPTPYGQMPAGLAKLMFPAMIRAQGQKDVEKMKGDTAESIQGQKSETAEKVAQTNKRYMAVPGVGLFDTSSNQLIPGTQQGVNITSEIAQEYGLPNDFVGKPMTVSQLAQVEKAQAQRAGRTTDTVEYKEDAFGNQIPLPKRTTSRPNLPAGPGLPSTQPSLPTLAPTQPAGGAKPPATTGGRAVPGFTGKNATQMVVGTDPQSRQVAGTPAELQAAGVSAFTKLDSAEAAKVNTARQMTSPGGLFNLIDKDLARFKPGELEALGPRWNEFLAGTVGTADSRYVALRTHVNGLLSTALMQAHVGARGGERIMEHFEDIANAGKMSMPTLRAALDAEKEYVQEKAMRPTVAQPAGKGAQDPLGIR